MSLDHTKVTYEVKQQPLAPANELLVARNYAIIDIGTHMESYKGQPAKPNKKVMLFFELPQHLVVYDETKGPQPISINQKYNFIAGDRSNLLRVLRSWGKSPKLDTLNIKPYLGQYCMLKLVHEPSKSNPPKLDTTTKQVIVYQKIADGGKTVEPLMDGFRANIWHPEKNPAGTIKPHNPNVFFDLDFFSWDAFNKLPKWVQGEIQKCNEWADISAKAGAPPVQAATQPQQPQYVPPVPSVAVPQATAPVMAGPTDVPNF